MKGKQKSYLDVLKEALGNQRRESEDYADIPDNVDVTGPFVDGIISYTGDGELKTHKDAASILERYYFKEDKEMELLDDIKKEKIIKENEDEKKNDDEDENKIPLEPEEDIDDAKEDVEDELLSGGDDGDALDVTEAETRVLEKLISDMEAEVVIDFDKKKEEDENENEAAGEGDGEKELKEQDEDEEEGEEEEEEIEGEKKEKEGEEEEDEEEVLDVDKEIEEAITTPLFPHQRKPEDLDESLEEQYTIFKEEIEE